LRILKSRLAELEQERREQELARERGGAQQADFGSQIRSYVLHPYQLVKDHRTEHETGNTQAVLDGALDEFIHEYLLAKAAGKVTVIRLVLKEIEPTAGKSVVGGRDLTRLKRSKVPLLRRNIGCVFQDFKLLPNRTAAENVAYALKVQGEGGNSIRRKVPEVLNLVGLAHKMSSYPDELSGGEQQRVSIARAVVNHPPLLICDEPTGNLDPDTSVGIMQLLYRINRAGTTVLMATHDREMVDKMRRRVIALDDGRLARDERRGGYAS